jgi:hypothetical protein
MPEMPEIIGETQIKGPDLSANIDKYPLIPQGVSLWKKRFEYSIIDSETYASPLMIRLIDFSGEGERAPPG